MRFFKIALASLLLIAGIATAMWYQSHKRPSYVPYNAELEYLKVINHAAPATDPRIALLLMAEFNNANRTEEGIQTFESLLEKYEPQLSKEQKAMYLAALGLLRAVHTRHVFPLKQPGWVSSTVTILEDAKQLSNNELFFIRWITGVVYTQLPGFFGKKAEAAEDLDWCLKNISKAIDDGWIREVYFHRALLYHQEGNDAKAQDLLRLSGYKSFDKKIMLTTNFSAELKKGHTAGLRKFIEVIPGKIYTLSGMEFSDFNFIISEDGSSLIAVDTGTTPSSAREGYELLKSKVPSLPPLTHVFITHAHWDHLGGHQYYRELNPNVRFISRENWRDELELVLQVPLSFPYFLGTDFNHGLVRDFKPTETISTRTDLTIGGTQITFIPISGGETEDAMFLWLPQYSVLYIGDFLMPYFGGPFKEEGNIPGLFEAIDIAVSLSPKHLIHGHDPLTKVLADTETLAHLKNDLSWLHTKVLSGLHDGKGMSRVQLHHQNFVPPNHTRPQNQIAYLLTRENFINRAFDKDQGYWEIADLKGLNSLDEREYGALLTTYMELSESQIGGGIESMLKNGDYLLAEETTKWALTQFPESERLKDLRKQIYLRLKEKYQALNPFRFIIYSQMIEDETPQLQYEE